MTQKENLKTTLLSGLVLISMGGWLLHNRIHPPVARGANFLPFFAGIISAVFVPMLFLKRGTVLYAYILNGMIVILGTIGMAHFSLANPPRPVTIGFLLLLTLFADILLLWGKFAIGKTLFELEISEPDAPRGVRTFRLPNMGWWWVHLSGMSLVYYLGHSLWR